jgi:glucose-1-phosphate cytidylyltransferase
MRHEGFRWLWSPHETRDFGSGLASVRTYAGGNEMKVAILAGGVGSRLSEETVSRPKPMVEIGGRPILWHIMRHYHHYGFKDFVIALGYKGEQIKKYFVDYCELNGSLTVDMSQRKVTNLERGEPIDWKVELVDTGVKTNTGGRIKRLKDFVGNETFLLTWGDGVSNIDLRKLVDFHKSHGKLATLTAVHPVARFGQLELSGDSVSEFSEKPQTKQGWINGAFFVLEPKVFDYIEGDETQWDYDPMQRLAKDGQLMAYKHEDFWQCMDTLREKKVLEDLWESGKAPWKLWA